MLGIPNVILFSTEANYISIELITKIYYQINIKINKKTYKPDCPKMIYDS